MAPKSKENAVAVIGPVWWVTTCLLAMAPEPYPSAEIKAAVTPIHRWSRRLYMWWLSMLDIWSLTFCIYRPFPVGLDVSKSTCGRLLDLSLKINVIPIKISIVPPSIIRVSFSSVNHTARPIVIKGAIPITLDALDAPAYLTPMKLKRRPIGYESNAFNNMNSNINNNNDKYYYRYNYC